MLSCGIVGLPNVGKSTLFNALLRRQQALVANYPFATIEPNIGIVPVPDERLTRLAEIVAKSEGGPSTTLGISLPPLIPAVVQFVDIAGLVAGASQGAGLGNKFLSHIRETDLICQVVRAFPDAEIIREGSTEPEEDIETVNTELILADLQTLGRMIDKSSGIKDRRQEERKEAIEKLRLGMNQGKLASQVELTDEGRAAVKELQLLTLKKMVYVFNVNTTTGWKGVIDSLQNLAACGFDTCVVDAKLESELSLLHADEQQEYLESLGVLTSGLDQLIQLAYRKLDLISFLTAGVKEVRAWTVPRGTRAPQAAAVVHTDFEKNFIKAEVVDYENFIKYNGWKKVREMGAVRFEGKEYEVRDGDVIEFKVNV